MPRGRAMPGHLKAAHDRSQDASYAVLDLEEDTVRVAIHELDGRVRREERFTREEIKHC